MKAAQNGNNNAVSHILDLDANVNEKTSQGKTALMLAASNGHTDTAKLLIDRGADVKAQDAFGTTALIVAATAGHNDTAQLLLSYGADPTWKDSSDGSALGNATFFGHTQTIQILLEDRDISKTDGEELLLLAAGLGHSAIVKLLLERGIDPNSTGIKQRTALMAAAAFDRGEVAELLIAHGAALGATDEDGVNALDVANAKGNRKVIRILEEQTLVQEKASRDKLNPQAPK